MSDNQRQRVYKAEWAVREYEVALPTLDHIKALVTLIERLDWYPEDSKGVMVSSTMQTRKAYYCEGTIHLPARGLTAGEWAWTDLTVIHEVAHHLAPGRGHDEVFTSYVLRILEGLGRTHVALALRQSYADHGVKVFERTAA